MGCTQGYEDRTNNAYADSEHINIRHHSIRGRLGHGELKLVRALRVAALDYIVSQETAALRAFLWTLAVCDEPLVFTCDIVRYLLGFDDIILDFVTALHT